LTKFTQANELTTNKIKKTTTTKTTFRRKRRRRSKIFKRLYKNITVQNLNRETYLKGIKSEQKY